MKEEVFVNPITNRIKGSFEETVKKINIAVPFLSSFTISLFNENGLSTIKEKRLITRFDESSISSYDLKTLKKLLDFGFEIRYNNEIHLKLYITDNDTFITSSNMTQRGFEENIELTVRIDKDNISTCNNIFDEIWKNNKENSIDYSLIKSNWGKYELLKKREKFNKKTKKEINIFKQTNNKLDVDKLLNEIVSNKEDYSNISTIVFKANKLRDKRKRQLLNGFNSNIFYVPEGHKLRRKNLFYDFSYGYERDLASTGLRELQFRTAFLHPDFKKVVEYIIPELVGLKKWNLDDSDELLEFCEGIFEFDIPQYTESLPIRLASYFYPNHFLQIFKLDHLKKICTALGLETNAKTKGERFFTYNTLLLEKMSAFPYNNYIKAHISYRIMYAFELFNKLNEGRKYEDILSDYKETWKKDMVSKGKELLMKLEVIKSES